jgi:hypothetical protein
MWAMLMPIVRIIGIQGGVVSRLPDSINSCVNAGGSG